MIDAPLRREFLTGTVIGTTIHARYRTATRTLCGLDAPKHEPNHWLPDCGTCSRVARAWDHIDGSMPDHWRPFAVEPEAAVKHEAFIRMILDGPDKGQWVAWCKGCDWHIGPRPIDPTLGQTVQAHMREAIRAL